ncbi:MarR family transcriptional regulator [Treponema sp.]|uniref:MarR family winged helix-turn-helix transcriptional regulator n=1 Tax=Treponema sp. TaxID=166 RepID=UPI00298D8989|nr:MarR family transcriptional regulator [Treponema sp.]
MGNKYDALKLDNQLCFPLYAVSKEIVRRYTPFLNEIDLTYTQYIAMMVMWEHREMSVKELGKKLLLDSGTLTPLLKTLEKKELVTRVRSKEDERFLVVSITDKGMKLREKAVDIPAKIGSCVQLSKEEAVQLYATLRKLLSQFDGQE